MNNTNAQREAVVGAIKLAASKGTRISPNSKLLRAYKATLPVTLPQNLLAVAVGNMLGDAYLQPNSNGTEYRLRFEWGGMNEQYALYIYELFKLYCLSVPRNQTRTNANGNLVNSWPFQTVNHSSFNVLADIFLVNGRKSINLELLRQVFTPVSLAYWFMDDGEGSKDRYGITLHTQGFTPEEVEMLCQLLRDLYELNCWI